MEVPRSTRGLSSSDAYFGPGEFEAACRACPYHKLKEWRSDGTLWWFCSLCKCWSAESHVVCKTHKRNVQRAQKHGTEQAVLAEPEEVQQMADMDASRQDKGLPKGPMEGMFSLRVFQYAPCGTYLIARSGTYTVKDCRTEQRARWDNIRWRAQMQRAT